MVRTGQWGTTFLTPPITRPPLTRQDFRSPWGVDLAGEDCMISEHSTSVCKIFDVTHKKKCHATSVAAQLE